MPRLFAIVCDLFSTAVTVSTVSLLFPPFSSNLPPHFKDLRHICHFLGGLTNKNYTHRTEARVQTTALSEGLRFEQFQCPVMRLVVSHRSMQPQKLCTTAKHSAWPLPSFTLVCISVYC